MKCLAKLGLHQMRAFLLPGGLGQARLYRKAIKVIDFVCRFREDPTSRIFNSVLDVLVKEILIQRKSFLGRRC
ncbi:hypothetical protein Sjap_016963 [Stephania japonica]|uniref:Uncharacterized protein n=1 Tax=Stephania japonica TaxID=461633 RepID=A0AAP0I5D1_9MAGN